MSENSAIQWTHHTFNPWWGCTKVHSGCANCYAESWDARWGGNHWGKDAPRRMVLGEWSKPAKWNREAEAAGERRRVFCASMADLFEQYPADRPVVDQRGCPIKAPRCFGYTELLQANGYWNVPALRSRVFDIIEVTPWLDWLLLTKRPENVLGMAPPGWRNRWPANAWVGTSPCDQKTADVCIPALLRVAGATGARTFLSIEPLLGPLAIHMAVIKRQLYDPQPNWVIVGCESEKGAVGRFAEEYDAAALSIINECAVAGVPLFHKQMPVGGRVSGEPAEWAPPFRVRQFPVFGGVA